MPLWHGNGAIPGRNDAMLAPKSAELAPAAGLLELLGSAVADGHEVRAAEVDGGADAILPGAGMVGFR